MQTSAVFKFYNRDSLIIYSHQAISKFKGTKVHKVEPHTYSLNATDIWVGFKRVLSISCFVAISGAACCW